MLLLLIPILRGSCHRTLESCQSSQRRKDCQLREGLIPVAWGLLPVKKITTLLPQTTLHSKVILLLDQHQFLPAVKLLRGTHLSRCQEHHQLPALFNCLLVLFLHQKGQEFSYQDHLHLILQVSTISVQISGSEPM